MAKKKKVTVDDELALEEELLAQEALEPEEGGALVIELDEPLEEEIPLAYDESLPNLVETFTKTKKGQDALKKIADQVIDEVEESYEATEEYRTRKAQDWKLFSGDLPKKSVPFENCSNAHVPTMLENLSRIVFNAYGEIFGNWNNVFGVTPLGPEDEAEAEVLTVHGNWQLRTQIPAFKRQQHRGILTFFAHGDVASHSYWDETTELNSHEILTPDEFVVPFTYTTVKPDYADCPWVAKIIHRYKHELEALKDKWFGIDDLLAGEKPSWMDDPHQLMAEAMNEVHGIHAPDSDSRAPYKFYHYEGWLELPEQPKQRYCQCIIEAGSRTIVKLSIHEDDNWQDRERYEMQLQERDQYFAMRAEHEMLVQSMQQQIAELEMTAQQAMPEMGPEQSQQLYASLQELSSAPLPPPPVAPAWMTNPDDPEETPEKPRREPIRLFAHGVCIEPLVGNLGIGPGRILADYNRAANTALSQFTDAATLNNTKSLLTTDQIEFDGPGGRFSVGPGKVNKVRGVSSVSLKDNIIPLEFGPANNQLLDVVDRMQKYAQSAAASPEVMGGAPGKSGETYRGLSARLEQATKVLSVPTRKYLDFFEQILKNNAYLNSVFLREEEIFMVANHVLRQVEPLTVGRKMYERNYQVEFRSDLRFTSMAQRVSEADEIVEMGLKHPVLAQNIDFQIAALKKAFEARGRYDLMQLVRPPPPMPPVGPDGQPLAPPGPDGPPGGMEGPPRGPDNATAPEPPPGAPGPESPVTRPGAPPQ